MDFKYKQLEHELSALSRVFGELGARLSEVAKDVTSPGVTPPDKLIEQISTARTNFDNVRSAVHGHATAMLVSPLPKIGELVSVTAIDTLLKASTAAEENKLSIDGERDRALNILSRVLAITHKESAEFKPLQECQAKVDELRIGISKTAWPHRHPEIDSVTGLKHPVTALLSFVENLDTLEDDRWIALETTITETFGKPLFVAASRGKLVVPKADKPVAAAPAPTTEKKLVSEKAPEKPAAPPAAQVDKKVTSPAPAPAPVAATPQKPPTPPVASERKDAAEKPQTVVAPPQPPVPAPTPTPAVTPITVNATPAPAPAAPASVQTPAAASPVAPAAPAPIVAATPTIPAPTVPAAAAPAPAAPAPQRAPAATPAPAAVTQTPATVIPASSTPPPAPIGAAPTAASTAPTPVAAAPAPAASAPTPSVQPVAAVTNAPTAQNNTIPSLTALATATEPATDRKPAAPPVETIDKQRKEPRLAAPAPQPMAKSESKSQEGEMVEQNALAADASQRPQRWGFWRGNR